MGAQPEPIIIDRPIRPKSRRKQYRTAGLTLVAVLIMVVVGYRLFVPREQPTTVREYTTARVAARTIEQRIQAAGTITLPEQTAVLTPERGFLDAVSVDVGDWVEAGQVVARLDLRELADSLEDLLRDQQKQALTLERFVSDRRFAELNATRERSLLLRQIVEAEDELARVSTVVTIQSTATAAVERAVAELRDAQEASDAFVLERRYADQQRDTDRAALVARIAAAVAERERVAGLVELEMAPAVDLADAADAVATQQDALVKFEAEQALAASRAERERLALDRRIADARSALQQAEALTTVPEDPAGEVARARTSLRNAREALDAFDLRSQQDAATYDLTLQGHVNDRDNIAVAIERMRERIASGDIRSPMAGQVMEIYDSAQRTGALIAQYSSLMTIADTTRPVMTVAVPEQYVSALSRGYAVTLNINNDLFPGTVERVGLTAQQASDGSGLVVPVEVRPDAAIPGLVPGGTVVADILLGVREGVVTLPRGQFLTTGNQRYVFVIDGTRAVRTDVVFGSIQATSVEIVSGLAPGDEVITSGYQNYIDKTEVILEDRQ